MLDIRSEKGLLVENDDDGMEETANIDSDMLIIDSSVRFFFMLC